MKVVFTIDGMNLHDIATKLMEQATRRRLRNYLLRPDSNDAFQRAYRVMHDRLGDPYRVYRELHRHRPGRGYLQRQKARELACAA